MRNKTYFLTGSPVRWNALRLPDVAESYLAVCPDAMQIVSSNAAVAGTSDPAEIDASSEGDLADAHPQALECAVYAAYADAQPAAMPYPEASNITIGQANYNLALQVPKGTEVTWGVNLGTDDITAATLEAQALHTAFTSPEVRDAGITLEFVEIGNEADLYCGNDHRNSSWNIQEYVQQCVRWRFSCFSISGN